MAERQDAKPNPTVEGTEFKAVWSFLRNSRAAKLVTVHFFD